MLSGTLPFASDLTENELFMKIKSGDYEFEGLEWERVSEDGKDFVSRLLIVDPERRMVQVSKHPWIVKSNKKEK